MGATERTVSLVQLSGRLGQWERVGQHHLIERGVLESVDRGRRQHAVRGGDRDAQRPLGPEQLGGVGHGPGGADDVVDDDGVASLHLTDDGQRLGDVVLGRLAALVDEGDVGAEVAGELLGPLHPAGIWRDHRRLALEPLLEVIDQDRAAR